VTCQDPGTRKKDHQNRYTTSIEMKSVKMKLNSPGIKYAGQKQTAKRNGYADGAGQRAKEG
jgi:hypothetical protein